MNSRTKCRGAKTNDRQWNIILDFMAQNKSLVTGKLRPGENPQKIHTLWCQLALILNSEGNGPKKTVEGWRKTWVEFKSHTKKRARDNCGINKQLSSRDQRLLELISKAKCEEGQYLPVEIENIKSEGEEEDYEEITEDVAPTEDVSNANIANAIDNLATAMLEVASGLRMLSQSILQK